MAFPSVCWLSLISTSKVNFMCMVLLPPPTLAPGSECRLMISSLCVTQTCSYSHQIQLSPLPPSKSLEHIAKSTYIPQVISYMKADRFSGCGNFLTLSETMSLHLNHHKGQIPDPKSFLRVFRDFFH